MKECKHISDVSSILTGSTSLAMTEDENLCSPTPRQKRIALRTSQAGGPVQVSTGCNERSGGNRQATTADRTRYRAGRYGNHSVLIGAWRVLWNSANHKRQRQFVRAAYGCLISSQSGEAGSPGNRNQRIL